MMRILFVDDEPNLLAGLRRMLRPHRNEWEVFFAGGGQQALELMEKTPVDVIVTDMRMPGMDGATLLEHVFARYPGVMRIVLSGHFDVKDGMRAVPVAHQFLTKPCNPAQLKAVIERSSPAENTSPDEATRRVVSTVGSLPSPPKVCTALMEMIQDPEVSVEKIARLINRDVALSAKVLQLVNSAFFSLSAEVSDIGSAVAILGMDVLRQLVLSAEVMRAFSPGKPVRGFSLDAFERHSQTAASIASQLSPPAARSLNVMAALLHDAGKLILASRMPESFEIAITESQERQIPLHEYETEAFGTTHAEIGSYLLNLWGLPEPVIDAIALHHQPGALPPLSGHSGDGPDHRTVVHVANALAHELNLPGGGLPAVPRGIDLEFLQNCGMDQRISEWRAISRSGCLQ